MFSPEEVTAINRVDIQLRFGVHGTRDRHYLQAIRAVHELNPRRGDVLAVENPGYCEGGINYTAYIEPAEGVTLARAQQQFLRAMRQSRALHAFAYGALAACFKDIRVVAADANYNEWQPIQHLPIDQRSALREHYALEDLGQHALDMAQELPHSQLGRPVLMLLFGRAHQESMERKCRDAGIDFSSRLMPSQYDRIIDKADISLSIARELAQLALPLK